MQGGYKSVEETDRGCFEFPGSRSPTQRHDVESVASAGANPAASTNPFSASVSSVVQQQNSGLLNRTM